MAREYGFTVKEKGIFYLPERVYSSFGRDYADDFIALFIYDTTGETLLGTHFIDSEEVSFDQGGNFIDLNVGQHLRDAGFDDGEFTVTYKFLRRLAGREEEVFVDNTGEIWEGNVTSTNVNGQVRYFTSSPNPGIDGENVPLKKELFIRNLNYVLEEMSPDRTEAIITVDDVIKNEEYYEDFQTMSELIEYKSLKLDNAGAIRFDTKNPYIMEFDINDLDRGFTQNMVGGEIVIPNLYQTEESTLVNDDYIVKEIVEVDFLPPPPPPPAPKPKPEPEPDIQYNDWGVADPLGPNGGGRS